MKNAKERGLIVMIALVLYKTIVCSILLLLTMCVAIAGLVYDKFKGTCGVKENYK